MKKKNKLSRIIQWFFEEDVNQVPANNEAEAIELGPIQIILILAMTALLLVWIFFEPIKAFFYPPQPAANEYIEKYIEKNYFARNPGLENNDFSKGFEHWVTSDGGRLFPDSKSLAMIDTKDFHSAPSSLKIECVSPANRYHYSKKVINGLVNNAYSFKQTECWLGVLPGDQLSGSFWYKGDIVKFSINYLREDGEWKNLESVSGVAASQWTQLAINKKLPQDARAIMIEITLNQAQDMSAPVVWIDDVILKIENPVKINE